MARAKICGINDAASMRAACAAGADWIGFVFVARSARAVTPAVAETLSALHPGGPLRVGLFVDPTDDEVEAALEAVPLDVLQVYAEPARAAELRAAFGVAVWRAIGVREADDLPRGREAIDGYVLDSAPAGAELPGGNGAGFDAGLVKGWAAPLPWVLAGGLTPQTVAAAVAASGAASVDVSSGVERARGVKDPALIAAFVRAAHAAGG
jgi:phosphoribosylanthranilate isomerase